MRVFLAANVLFSACNKNSSIAQLIDWLLDVGEAVTSDLARAEAQRNLERRRPAWRSEFARLLRRLEIVPSTAFEIPVTLDPGDIPLLCSAIRNRCTHFVTGDRRDFRHLYDTAVEGVRVISLLRLAEILVRTRST